MTAGLVEAVLSVVCLKALLSVVEASLGDLTASTDERGLTVTSEAGTEVRWLARLSDVPARTVV